MHIYSKDQQMAHLGRTRGEKWLARLFLFTVFIQTACFVMSIFRVARYASNSMDNSFFVTSSLKLRKSFLRPDCSMPVSGPYGFFSSVTYTISKDNVGYIVSRCVTNFRFLFFMTAIYILVCSLNRFLVGLQVHELRYHFVVFRKDTLLVWEVFLTVLGIVFTHVVNAENALLTKYITRCNGSARNEFSSAVPMIELLLAYYLTLVALFFNGIIAIAQLSKANPRKKIIEEEMRQGAQYEMNRFQTPGLQPEHGLERSASRSQTLITLERDAADAPAVESRLNVFPLSSTPPAPTPGVRSEVVESPPSLMVPVAGDTEETVEVNSRV